jgi:hypothetical protein
LDFQVTWTLISYFFTFSEFNYERGRFYPCGNELDERSILNPRGTGLSSLGGCAAAYNTNIDSVIFESDAQAVLLIANRGK